MSSPSRGDSVAVVACGALARHVADIAARRGWPVDVHPLPPLLHNHPDEIAPAVAERVAELRGRYAAVAVGFADCGTYGALDEVCARLGVRRLAGGHCYDVFGGADRVAGLLTDEPGTYLLTDFLVASFRRSVVVELGLDRHPELHEEYFRHYRRVVWLAQHPTPGLRAQAEQAAAFLRLPLQVVPVGDGGLERDLEHLLHPGSLSAPRVASTLGLHCKVLECAVREVGWNEPSEEHVARHGVEPTDVEEVVSTRPRWSCPGRDGTELVYGTTDAGRYLMVVLAEGADGRHVVVTARDMDAAERRLFTRRAR